jgi:hypothetical protein
MEGGHSSVYIKFPKKDSQDDNLMIQNIELDYANRIYLSKNYNGKEFTEFSSKYLDDLMELKNEVINIDFLNNFNRTIYVDYDPNLIVQDSNYEIIRDGDMYKFKKEQNYIITKKLDIETGGGEIFFLKKKDSVNYDLPEELVLKVMGIAYPHNIKDYLSLEITKIIDGSDHESGYLDIQNNFTLLGRNKYETQKYNKNINYNPSSKLYGTNNISREDLKTEIYEKNDDSLYLSCKNDAFVTEIINNLLLSKILKSDGKFVKYHSYFITQVNGVYKQCILMDKMDGSIDWIFDNIFSKAFKEKDENKENVYTEFIDTIFTQIFPVLLKLKKKDYLFTHTDMKIENIFYRKVKNNNFLNFDDDNYITASSDGNKYCVVKKEKEKFLIVRENNGDEYIFFYYLADFDKSSISWKGIRFYHDFATSHEVAKLLINTQKMTNQSLLDFSNKNDENFFDFNRSSSLLETEVFAMRYHMFPFYLCFDFQSLVLSIFSHTKLQFQKIDIFFSKNITPIRYLFGNDDIENNENMSSHPMVTIFNIYKGNVYGGNFGNLLLASVKNPGISSFLNILPDKINEKFNMGIDIENKTDLSKIIIPTSPIYHKIIIGYPFLPRNINKQIQNYFLSYLNLSISKITEFNNDTVQKYKELNIENIKFTDVKLYEVYYNGNKSIDEKLFIVKTNRYRVGQIPRASHGALYEYDGPLNQDDTVKQIAIMLNKNVQTEITGGNLNTYPYKDIYEFNKINYLSLKKK